MRRAGVVYAALRGDLDDVPGVVQQLAESRALADRLRGTVVRTSEQAHYWYKLWFGMGTEFAKAQDLLVAEVDRLRRKCGEHDGVGYLDTQMQRSYRERWVAPKSHPVKGVGKDTLAVPVPPEQPAELIERAESEWGDLADG